jgi:phage tail-like protein
MIAADIASRGHVEGLQTPHPLLGLLPAIYHEDGFTRRYLSALDEVLAPIVTTLDCLDSYFDPCTAPRDFLAYLAGWLGVVLREWSDESDQRDRIARLAAWYDRRGTTAGLVELMELFFHVVPDVDDNGGVTVASEPGTAIDDAAPPAVHVRLRIDEPHPNDEALLARLMLLAVPAHVQATVEIVGEHVVDTLAPETAAVEDRDSDGEGNS